MSSSNIFDPESKREALQEATRLTIPPTAGESSVSVAQNLGSPLPGGNAINKGDSSPVEIGIGTTLKERFIIEKEIARGGMGVVYQARDIRKVQYNDRNPFLAIKVLGEECKAHPDSFIALQREAGKAQMLAHPNIVTVYDFDSDGDTVFMTMEYLEGESLQHLFKRKGSRKLPVAQVLNIIDSVGQGLAYAHQKGIVHCDLKPGNIFITKDDVIKILDFGIARAVKHPEQHNQEATRFDPASLGALTPAYASCELIENAQPDPRDDIYSLACVAYEMLQGRHPFNKMPADAARDNNLKPAPIKGLPKQQWKMLQQGLAFNRVERPASVETFLAGLCREKPRARWPRVVAAVFVLGVLASSALYFYPTTQSPPTPVNTAAVSNSTPAQPPVQLTEEQQQTISHLLEAADIHFAVHRITEPEGSNAYAAYQHVLAIDPNNAQAKAGLLKIADYYDNLAQQNLQKGDVKNAQSMIKIGLKVLPSHAGLLALLQQTQHQSKTQAVVNWFKAEWKIISQ